MAFNAKLLKGAGLAAAGVVGVILAVYEGVTVPMGPAALCYTLVFVLILAFNKIVNVN